MANLFKSKTNPVAVRRIEIDQPLQPLDDVTDYASVQIFVTSSKQLLGQFQIENRYKPISVAQLASEISGNLASKIIESQNPANAGLAWNESLVSLAERIRPDLDCTEPVDWLVDLSKPLRPLNDVIYQDSTDIVVTWQGAYVGTVKIHNNYKPITVTRLRQEIAETIGLKILRQTQYLDGAAAWSVLITHLANHFSANSTPADLEAEQLPHHVSVSIVVATLDRPDDLRNCLRSLVNQDSRRPIDIVVVDNNPDSGLTPPVVAEFDDIVLVKEYRKGLAYARNAGFVASTGDIAIATDDDVTAPPDWIERLVAPFARGDVMIVTGNVLPLELETAAQQYFEMYGGLGRGFTPFEVNGDWFEAYRFFSVPTWELGATANAAFRTTIFANPKIGLMEESLGPGMPSGVGEDTYLYYKVLKAGYTIVYEPKAYVWHKHRRTMESLRRQLYNYSKGGVGYHLTLVINDGDLRGLARIFIELPRNYLWRVNEWLRGRSDYPLSLLLLEMWGNLMGFWALPRSWWRVKREGHSNFYIPVSQRSYSQTKTSLISNQPVVEVNRVKMHIKER